MFRGLNAINLDEKGRLAVPKRYRERLEDDCSSQMITTIDTDSACLLLYPLHEWEIIERKLENLPSFNPLTRRIQRLLIGHATEGELDSNGRLLVPPLLRDYAGLDKKLMLVGQGRKFEIWGESQWLEGRDRWLTEQVMEKDKLPEELQTISL